MSLLLAPPTCPVSGRLRSSERILEPLRKREQASWSLAVGPSSTGMCLVVLVAGDRRIERAWLRHVRLAVQLMTIHGTLHPLLHATSPSRRGTELARITSQFDNVASSRHREYPPLLVRLGTEPGAFRRTVQAWPGTSSSKSHSDAKGTSPPRLPRETCYTGLPSQTDLARLMIWRYGSRSAASA
jgi:hypothetical protein